MIFLFLRFSDKYFLRLRETAVAWMNHSRCLEGTGELDKLNTQELNNLVSILEVFI
jgi:hypothetical protein